MSKNKNQSDPPPPTLRELLLEQLRVVGEAVAADVDVIEFCDDSGIDYDALQSQASRESVTYAVGYLRGAHEALDVTMRDMLDAEDIGEDDINALRPKVKHPMARGHK